MNNATRFEYDKLGNVTRKIDPNGNTTNLVYDGLNRVISKTDGLGYTEYFQYDGNGKVLVHTDKRGNETFFEYDVLGNLIKTTDPEEGITTYTYDANNNREQITDPNNIVTRFAYDALNRMESKIIGFESNDERTTRYRYDLFNRLVKEIKPKGNYAVYQYDPSGNLILKILYDQNDQEMRREQRVYYADARNLLQELIIDNGKNGSETGIVYEYDKLGRKTIETDEAGNQILYAYDGVGNLISTTTPLGISNRIYDAADRLVAQINPKGEETDYAWDPNNNLIWTRDPAMNESQIFYDALNRKIGDLDALGNVITYDYDANGNLISLTDQENNTTHYKFDAANRKVETQRPLGQRTRLAYDKGGRPSEIINGSGHRVAYTYNNLNKPLIVTHSNKADLTTPVKTTLMSYDANGSIMGYNDAVTSASYTYDGLDRRIETTVDYGTFSKTFSNAYPDNWTRIFTGPDNKTTSFAYDEAYRLTSVNHDTAGSVQYTDFLWNKVQKKITPAFNTDYTYDPNGRYTSITTKDSSAAVLLNRQYDYSPDNNLISRDTEHGNYTYAYDPVSRLTHAVVPQNLPEQLEDETYTYDGIGNRLTSLATTSAWQYNANNELLNHDATGYTHDASGNITARTGENPLNFIYDEANRMTQVQNENNETVAVYYYDPFGQRLYKEVEATRTYYLYSEQGLIAEYDTTGVETASYGYLPGTSNSVAPLYMKTANEYYWYQNDRLGTPQQLVAGNGTIVWDARYTSFGKATMATQTIVSNFRFPGQYFDAETGLHYNKNRYYDPETGRYFRTDPLGIEGGINLYAYCLNNPLRYTDPTGHFGADGSDSNSGGGSGGNGGSSNGGSDGGGRGNHWGGNTNRPAGNVGWGPAGQIGREGGPSWGNRDMLDFGFLGVPDPFDAQNMIADAGHLNWRSMSYFMSVDYKSPRPALTQSQKDNAKETLGNLIDNVSNFFPGPNTTVIKGVIEEGMKKSPSNRDHCNSPIY